MEEHPNAALARQGFQAFNAGDRESFADALADDIAWHYIGGAEPIRGRDAVLEFTGRFDIRFELHDVVANDEHVIALLDVTATRDGSTLAYRTAEIYHVADGKITERWAFTDDTAAIVAFFAE